MASPDLLTVTNPGQTGLAWNDVMTDNVTDNKVGAGFTQTDELGAWTKPYMDSWFLMGSIYPCLVIVFIYLVFVTKLGPLLMRHRSPLNVKTAMLVYNLLQVVFSVWLVVKICEPNLFNYMIRSTISYTDDHVYQPALERQVDVCGWYYLMSKFVEFIDTIFFVVRKKEQQVTFLHLYHHGMMAVATWYFTRYIRGSHVIFLALINLCVHSVMYAYYLLAACGPVVAPYLWWKKYITKIQIGQFLLCIVYYIVIFSKTTAMSPTLCGFIVVNTSSLLVLFLNFYWQTYNNNKKQSKHHTD